MSRRLCLLLRVTILLLLLLSVRWHGSSWLMRVWMCHLLRWRCIASLLLLLLLLLIDLHHVLSGELLLRRHPISSGSRILLLLCLHDSRWQHTAVWWARIGLHRSMRVSGW